MTSIRHPWPFALVLASLCMISCNVGDEDQKDAGSDDASAATGTCDPIKCNASCLRIQGREGRCSLEDQCECIGGADGDADGDADVDTDTDADADADADGDKCDILWEQTPCDLDDDCGGFGRGCVCGDLLKDKESTSYCYRSCTVKTPCSDPDQTCVYQTEGDPYGICLYTGYSEHDWKVKFVPPNTIPPIDEIWDQLTFDVGSIQITFVSGSLLSETNDTDLGHLIIMTYLAQSATSQYLFQVTIPYDLFRPDTNVDFKDCQEKGLPCSATLIEATIQGMQITQEFVRAVDIVDATGKYENWVKIDTVNLARTKKSTGSWKLFFAEYSAEIPVD